MTLRDTMHGSLGSAWFALAVIAGLTIVLLTGKCSFLIAGYNTASQKEKDKFDAKKLTRVTGAGLLFISLMMFILLFFIDVLPSWFIYVFLGIVIASSAVMIILMNTICWEE